MKVKPKPKMQPKVFKKFRHSYQHWGDSHPNLCMHGTPTGRMCLQCHIDIQYKKNKKKAP